MGSIKDFKETIRGSLNCLDQNISRILDFKEIASEVLKEKRKNSLTENWRKEDPYYAVAKSLATRNIVEVKNVLSELDDVAKEISSLMGKSAT